jgi:trk system potassium uptake protein TrkH
MKRLDHLAMILRHVGVIFQFLGLVSLVPFIVLVIFGEWNLLFPMASAPCVFISIGYIISRMPVRDGDFPLSVALVAIAISWFAIALVGALPFVFGLHMPYIDALFEAMSGWSGTGFTMITSLDTTPKTLLFWRSFMQWIGGIGIIAFGLSAHQRLRVSLFPLFKAEGRPEEMSPTIASTSRKMWRIYLFLTIAFTGLVMLSGIPVWDATNLVMVAIATGCFTLHGGGLAYYNNPLLEVLLIPIMLAGAIPFKVFFFANHGKVAAMFRDQTVRILLIIACIGSFIVSLDLYIFNSLPVVTAFRQGVFISISGLSTCGLQNANLNHWAAIPIAILAMMVFIGGAIGSTAGGIKVNRVALAYNGVKWWFRRFFVSGRVIVPFRYEGRTLSKELSELEISKNMLIIMLYVITIFVSTIICVHLSVTTFHLENVVFEIISALSNAGLGFGFISAASPLSIKWVFILLMWLGRLEIVPVIILVLGIFKGIQSELVKEVPQREDGAEGS